MHCMVYTFVAFVTRVYLTPKSLAFLCHAVLWPMPSSVCPLHLSSREDQSGDTEFSAMSDSDPCEDDGYSLGLSSRSSGSASKRRRRGKPPQRVRSGSERLAVWASLQRLPVRAGETEPVWTDAISRCHRWGVKHCPLLASSFKAVWYSPCNIKRQNYHWSITLDLNLSPVLVLHVVSNTHDPFPMQLQ